MNSSIDQGLLDLLAEIRPAPIICMGCKSVILLRVYIDGYMYGRDKLEGNVLALREQMLGFQEYVKRRQFIQIAATWERTLKFVSGSDEAGLDRFWNLWDEFVTERTGQPPQWDPDLYKRRNKTVVERLSEPNLIPIGQGLLGLIADVHRDPATVLGHASILRLPHFINGCAHAAEQLHAETHSNWAMRNFQEYIQEEYSVVSSLGWWEILDFFAGGEEEGLNLFWKEWDAYLFERENNPARFEAGWMDRMAKIIDDRGIDEWDA